jgi:hypothetical protein
MDRYKIANTLNEQGYYAKPYNFSKDPYGLKYDSDKDSEWQAEKRKLMLSGGMGLLGGIGGGLGGGPIGIPLGASGGLILGYLLNHFTK